MSSEFRTLVDAAWFEHKVTRAMTGNAGEVELATPHAPGGFIAEELGFGFGEGPSLQATLQREAERGVLDRAAAVRRARAKAAKAESAPNQAKANRREPAAAAVRRLFQQGLAARLDAQRTLGATHHGA